MRLSTGFGFTVGFVHGCLGGGHGGLEEFGGAEGLKAGGVEGGGIHGGVEGSGGGGPLRGEVGGEEGEEDEDAAG